MNELFNQISSFDKLKLAEAQELYRKAISASNDSLRKEYMDKLILGTLYVVYNYISRNNLVVLSTRLYDIDDVISAFTEVWIQKIYNGELLSISKYSNLFTTTFFNEVYEKLGGSDFLICDLFGCSVDEFINLFNNYVELRRSNEKLNYDLLRQMFYDSTYESFAEDILLLFEKMYINLNMDINDINKTTIKNYLKLIIDASMFDDISGNIVDRNDMERDIINKSECQAFIRDVALAMKDEREKDIIYQRYGLGGCDTKKYWEIGKQYGITKDRVRQIEVHALRKLRYPSRKLVRYYKEGVIL